MNNCLPHGLSNIIVEVEPKHDAAHVAEYQPESVHFGKHDETGERRGGECKNKDNRLERFHVVRVKPE